jgi:hypothetical protein
MGTSEFNLLSRAYSHYLSTNQFEFSYNPIDGDDMFYSLEAVSQLLSDGYISNVPAVLLEDSVDSDIVITFNITDLGIKYMRSKREL